MASSAPRLVPLPRVLRLEACLWLARESFFGTAIFVPAGWLAAANPPGHGRLVALMVCVAILSGIGVALNDVLDREADAVTAPYLPLPAGLVTVRQALVTIGVGAALAIACLGLASPSADRFALGFTGITLFMLVLVAYSNLKPYPLPSALAHAALIGIVTAMGWLAAGGGNDGTFLMVTAAALVFGLAANVVAGLRDIDTDAEVGNHTLAASLGPVRAHLAILVLDLATIAVVVALAVVEDGLVSALPFVVLLLGFRLRSLGPLLRSTKRAGSDRFQRLSEMKGASLARGFAPIALIAVFSLPVALATMAVMLALLMLLAPLYERRIVRGGIASAAITTASADRG